MQNFIVGLTSSTELVTAHYSSDMQMYIRNKHVLHRH